MNPLAAQRETISKNVLFYSLYALVYGKYSPLSYFSYVFSKKKKTESNERKTERTPSKKSVSIGRNEPQKKTFLFTPLPLMFHA